MKTPSPDKRSLGRENRSVVETISEEHRQRIWKDAKQSIAPPNSLGCHLWKGSTQNGYPSVSQGHAKSKIKIHMLAVYIARKELPNKSEVCSHLCHVKRCCNADHIVIETITENSRRNDCLHSLKDEQGNVWNLCRHVPRCLQPDHSNLGGFKPHLMPSPPTA